MLEDPSKQPSIPDQLAELAVKVLKPGGVGVGSAYGLWLLFMEHKATEAIAPAVIGMCLSYGGNLWGEIHKGNVRRLEETSKAIDSTVKQLFVSSASQPGGLLKCQRFPFT